MLSKLRRSGSAPKAPRKGRVNKSTLGWTLFAVLAVFTLRRQISSGVRFVKAWAKTYHESGKAASTQTAKSEKNAA